jgi:general secretion pathway protein C
LSANGQRLFGQPAPAVAATTTVVPDSQIQVAGVIVQAQSPSKTAARTDQRSVALLAVDGKPPKPFSIGQTVTTGVTLTRVSAQEVVVTRNGAEVKLQSPKTGDISVLTAGKSASTTPSTYPPTPPAGSASFTPPPPPVAATVNTPSTSAGTLNPAPAGPAPIQTSPAASQPNIGQQVAEPAPTTTQDGSQPPTVGGSMRAGPPR